MSLPPKVVQRTPDLGLTIKLQPLAPEPEPAAPPAPCPPARVLDPAGEVVAELGCGEEYQYECPPGGECGGCDVSGVLWAGRYALYQYESGGEEYVSWDEVSPPFAAAQYYPGDARHIRGELPAPYPPTSSVFFGVPEGPDISGVRWVWAWDEPVLHDEQIEQVGPLLRVELKPSAIADGGVEYVNILRATAWCDTTQVGELSLMVAAMMH